MACAGLAVLILSLQAIHAGGSLQPPDRRSGFAWVALAGMAYSLGTAGHLDPRGLPGLIAEAIDRNSGLSGMSDSLPLIGLLFVCLCGLTAFSIRIRQVRLELERSEAALRIKKRELEQLRRNTERLAEISVLEERSRIAHEIHDAVGHTLTAAIVQLEATRRIAERRNCVPWEKLELLEGLVRKGLDDIRGAVKQIRPDAVRTLTLEAALRELIRYTEDTMEIAIETDISLAAKPEPGSLTEQVLYRALQEGLTNGIRHGRCARARFSLRSSGRMLRFRLVNDGEPYVSAVPGFGLTSMAERVKLLGGGVDIRPSVDADGNPVGCELAIDLPLVG